MRICFVAPANSVHTKKWCSWFKKRGHEVLLVSFTEPNEDFYVNLHILHSGVEIESSDFNKIKYLICANELKKIVGNFNPDIVNVHYATSYGTLAALAGLNHYILSVWGSDIYNFPRKSWIHRKMVQFSLKHAGRLFSTSQAMADEAAKYTDKTFDITPFGVDMDLFNPQRRKRHDNDFVIGTVKTLSPKYGIATLLKAAAIVRKEHTEIPLKIRIAGRGAHEKEYHELAGTLGLNDCLTWLGFISQEQAANEWANFDCAIIPSESESFGVSAVEAQSCACPVIISDIPGLMEATSPGKTSVVIPRGNVVALANAIVDLYSSKELRNEMGATGRNFVKNNYEINKCFFYVEKIYMEIVNSRQVYV